MKHQVRMTLKAEADVETVLGWFRDRQAIDAGSRWVVNLLRAVDTLADHPLRCGVAEESEDLGVEIRQLRIGKRQGAYRVLFLVDGQTVHILRVRHGAQDRLSREDL